MEIRKKAELDRLDKFSAFSYDGCSPFWHQKRRYSLKFTGHKAVSERQKSFGHVRQLVDSLPYKEEVRGSSPFVPTNSILDFRFRI